VPKSCHSRDGEDSKKISSEHKNKIKFAINSNEDNSFDGNIDECDLDEALNYADTTFDITEEEDEFMTTPLSTLENQKSAEFEDSNDEEQTEKYYDQKILSLQKEINERWKILSTFTDKETVRKCFDFFKCTFVDQVDFDDKNKMEKAHKYIKKQEIRNFRAMGFELFKLMNAYSDLKD
jgi:hypothetical protein